MRVRVRNGVQAEAVGELGSEEGSPSEGLVLAPAEDLADWNQVEEELTEVFQLTQEASAAGAPVVYLLNTRDVLGRGDARRAAVAGALCSGARALTFEGKRKGRVAVAISVSEGVSAQQLRETVKLAVSGALRGQVIALGDEHVGALLP